MSKLGLDEDDQNELWSTKAYLVQPALAATAELGIVKRKQFENPKVQIEQKDIF